MVATIENEMAEIRQWLLPDEVVFVSASPLAVLSCLFPAESQN